MNAENETRRLAPDTKWILTTVGSGFLILVGVVQYQLNQLQDIQTVKNATVLLQVQQNTKEAEKINTKTKELARSVIELRTERKKHRETLKALSERISTIIDVAIATQKRSVEADARLTMLINQARDHSASLRTAYEAQQAATIRITERLARLETKQDQAAHGKQQP